jgi:TPR repeat protein
VSGTAAVEALIDAVKNVGFAAEAAVVSSSEVGWMPELEPLADLPGDDAKELTLKNSPACSTGVSVDPFWKALGRERAPIWTWKALAEQGNAEAQYNLGDAYYRGESGYPIDVKQCVHWWTKAAKGGHEQAQHNLGFMYFNGDSVAKDAKKGLEWLTKAGEQGYVEAQYMLASKHVKGDGVAKDAKMGAEWMTKAAEQGHLEAQYDLASLYICGDGVPKNAKKGLELLVKSAELGFAEAQHRLALVYFKGGHQKKKAAEWMTKAAEQGHEEAQNGLARLFNEGSGVAKDTNAGVGMGTTHNLVESTEQGRAAAQFLTARKYSECDHDGVVKDAKKGLEWMTNAAEQGHADAKLHLALMNDDDDSFMVTMVLAEQGNSESQCQLALMYHKGDGVVQDYKKAAEWMIKAAEQGYAEAQCELAGMYLNGDAVAKNDKKAAFWTTKAAEQGHAEAQHRLARFYLHGHGVAEDDKKAAEWMTKAAEQGHAEAQCELARFYLNGDGVAEDEKKAAFWTTKAAEQGHANAQYYLASVAEDDKKAAEWMTKAAEQGHAEAQYDLASIYLNGVGVAKNEKEVVEWMTKAAEQGKAEAQYDLARFYLHGHGVAKNEKKVAEWTMKAAEQGNAEAQCLLADMYCNGNGVAEDDKKAAEWTTKAAEQGNADAQLYLASMYKNGDGVAQDYKKAVEWMTKAAGQGHVVAQYRLARFYLHGVGVARDEKKAVEWTTKAAEQGYEKAQQYLKQYHDEEAHANETKRLEVMAKLLEDEDEEKAKGGGKKAKKKKKKAKRAVAKQEEGQQQQQVQKVQEMQTRSAKIEQEGQGHKQGGNKAQQATQAEDLALALVAKGQADLAKAAALDEMLQLAMNAAAAGNAEALRLAIEQAKQEAHAHDFSANKNLKLLKSAKKMFKTLTRPEPAVTAPASSTPSPSSAPPASTPAPVVSSPPPAAALVPPANDVVSSPKTAGSLTYDLDSVLGEGSCGTKVYRGWHSDGREVAVKVMNKEGVPEHRARREMQLLQELAEGTGRGRDHVIQYRCLEEEEGKMLLGMELCECSLHDVISVHHQQIPLEQQIRIVRELSEAVAFLHEHQIVHRDVRPKNILFKRGGFEGAVKLTDFGLSKAVDTSDLNVSFSTTTALTGTEVGSFGYYAPDHHWQGNPTPKVDIFSLGCCMFYVFSGRRPFEDPRDPNNKVMMLTNIQIGRSNLKPVQHIREVFDLVASMIDIEAKVRPPAAHVLEHVLFWSDEKRFQFLCAVGKEDDVASNSPVARAALPPSLLPKQA